MCVHPLLWPSDLTPHSRCHSRPVCGGHCTYLCGVHCLWRSLYTVHCPLLVCTGVRTPTSLAVRPYPSQQVSLTACVWRSLYIPVWCPLLVEVTVHCTLSIASVYRCAYTPLLWPSDLTPHSRCHSRPVCGGHCTYLCGVHC